MNRPLPVLVGVLATVIASYVGLFAIPNWQLDGLQEVQLSNGDFYPKKLTASEQRGREVYVDLGCVYCHSQQVRQGDFGGDVSRGWGRRGSVPVDYIYSDSPLFGTMRTGPDLRNIGSRQPSRDWHYLHLYDPQITSKGSTMPPFPFLFREVPYAEYRVTGPPEEFLNLPAEYAVEGHYIVPTKRAKALVDYLTGLRYDAELPAGANTPTKEGTDGQ
jgi:cytochrome c oxidase cbb3-type subunit 2